MEPFRQFQTYIGVRKKMGSNTENYLINDKCREVSATTMKGDCFKAGCEGCLCFRHFRRSGLRGYCNRKRKKKINRLEHRKLKSKEQQKKTNKQITQLQRLTFICTN